MAAPHSALVIIEGKTSLTQCYSLQLKDFEPKVTGSLVNEVPKPWQVPSGE